MFSSECRRVFRTLGKAKGLANICGNLRQRTDAKFRFGWSVKSSCNKRKAISVVNSTKLFQSFSGVKRMIQQFLRNLVR